MSEPVPTFPNGDMTNADFFARAPELRALALQVVELAELTPRTRQARLTGPELARFSYQAGQDLMVLVDTSGGRIIRRRYTIRRFDQRAQLLDLNMVVHTDGPGARWARQLKVGDSVEAIGPRGKITLVPSASWHLLIGDDVAVPCMAAMVEALPAGARAVVIAEVADAAEELPVSPPAGVELSWVWLHRDGRAPDDPSALIERIRASSWPEGEGQAYVAGEAAAVKALQAALIARGFAPERVAAKAYWGRGRANASHGEPLRS
jgi:NADPH-dependent ferric siderophore reductase